MASSSSEPSPVKINHLPGLDKASVASADPTSKERREDTLQEETLKKNHYIPILDSFTPSSSSPIGQFAELHEVQLTVIILMVLDILSVAVEIYVRDTNVNWEENSSSILSVCFQLVESFTGFTIFFFLMEIGALSIAFRSSYFTHIGYLTDTFIILFSLYWQVVHHSKVMRLLSVFRIWRVVRFVQSLLTQEKNKHNATREALEEQQLLHSQMEKANAMLGKTVQFEREAKIKIEKTLSGYKDEVETLKEALNIAATSVAEASMEAYLAEDYENGEFDNDNEFYYEEQDEDESYQEEHAELNEAERATAVDAMDEEEDEFKDAL